MAGSISMQEIKEIPALAMKGICKSFGPTIALDEVNFDVARAEVHALVGENGAGKSTLAKAILGIQPLKSGQIFIDGKPS